MKFIMSVFFVLIPALAAAGCMHGGACPMGGGGGCPYAGTIAIFAYLSLLAFGYWILRKAVGDKGYAKWVGQGVAWIILLAGLGGLACKTVKCLKKYKQGCEMSSAGGVGHMCPIPPSGGTQSSEQNMGEDKEIQVERRIIRRKKQ